MIARDFFERSSGDKFYQRLTEAAKYDADLSALFYRLSLAHQVRENLPGLLELQAAQAERVQELGDQLKGIDGRLAKMSDWDEAKPDLLQERAKVDLAYDTARGTLPHIEQAVRSLQSIKEPPAPPAWLVDWLRETI